MSGKKCFLCQSQKSDIDLKAAVQCSNCSKNFHKSCSVNKTKVDKNGVFKACCPDLYESGSDDEYNPEVDSLDDNLRALYNAINKSLDNKFAKLEAKLDEKFDKFKNDVKSTVDAISHRVDVLEEKIANVNEDTVMKLRARLTREKIFLFTNSLIARMRIKLIMEESSNYLKILV